MDKTFTWQVIKTDHFRLEQSNQNALQECWQNFATLQGVKLEVDVNQIHLCHFEILSVQGAVLKELLSLQCFVYQLNYDL